MTADLLDSLLFGRDVDESSWTLLWRNLEENSLAPSEASAVLAAASANQPSVVTLANMVRSLQPSGTSGEDLPPDVINIVGTGGGPATFNISTAASVLAASCGVKVVKTGSRGYTSRLGATDLIGRAGISAASSIAEARQQLTADSLSFIGQQLYPPQLVKLARLIVPVGMKSFGALLNAIGPFLAIVPAGTQLTGLSERVSPETALALSSATPRRHFSFTVNGLRVDELINFTDNTVFPSSGAPYVVGPEAWPLVREGSLEDLSVCDQLFVGRLSR